VLQYADDTIICLKDDLDKARNQKLLLSVFEQMSDLKINFDKSEVLTIGGDNTTTVAYADIFTCQISMFSLKYLGVPISARRLRVIDWCKLEEKIEKKLDVWQGNCLSYGGRSVLINSSLFNTPIYHMSMFMVPKTVIKRMDKMGRKLFCQGGSLKKKRHLVKWSKICKAKKKGGLGMKNLRKLNISLLFKWWWLLENEQGLW
jgi:hypothetical protein